MIRQRLNEEGDPHKINKSFLKIEQQKKRKVGLWSKTVVNINKYM